MLLKVKINIVIPLDITEYIEKEIVIEATSMDLKEIKTKVWQIIKDKYFISDIILIQ